MMAEIRYECSEKVRDAIASLGRTEDVRFSPNNRRLAVVAFERNQIAIFDVVLSSAAGGVRVALAGGVQLTSLVLNEPHGVAFLDDDNIIVANRGGGNVVTFKLPAGSPELHFTQIDPSDVWLTEASTLVKTPSTVSVTRLVGGVSEILICDHTEHVVTRHVVHTDGRGIVSREVLLRKLLLLPDGAVMSPDRRWIAVSNHATRSVLMYDNATKLSPDTEPAGILRRIYAPHGLRFSEDGQHLIIADAEAPNLVVYRCQHNDWSGIRNPTTTIRIMDDQTFRQGHVGRGEGGPKGLDIDAGSRVVVVTSKCQPLAFFDLSAVLQQSAMKDVSVLGGEDYAFERCLMDDHRILADVHRLLEPAQRTLGYMINSQSWRITAPLRWLDDLLRGRL